MDAEELALHSPVLSTVKFGGLDWTKSRTEAALLVTPSLGMGMVYVSVASSPTTSMPSTKLRMSALRSRERPLLQELAEVRHVLHVISSVFGSSTLRCSS